MTHLHYYANIRTFWCVYNIGYSLHLEQLIKVKEEKKRIKYLLNKCFENAYTNIGNLNIKLKNDEERNLIFLFKYDERFSILKRIWRQKIKEHLSTKISNDERLKIVFEEEKQKLDELIYPQPFSKALSDFSYCIEQIGRDKFSYIINPDQFDDELIGWSPEKLLHDRIIPIANKYLKDFNNSLCKKFPYLKGIEKKTLDANYYLFFFNRKYFKYFANQDSIPNAIKRFLVREILESEKAGEHLASQLIYIKQVINNLSLSGLLFTENLDTQEQVRKIENKLLKNLKTKGIIINNINDLASIGNNIEYFIIVFFESFYNREFKVKRGKRYLHIKRLSELMINNSKELINTFNQIKVSE